MSGCLSGMRKSERSKMTATPTISLISLSETEINAIDPSSRSLDGSESDYRSAEWFAVVGASERFMTIVFVFISRAKLRAQTQSQSRRPIRFERDRFRKQALDRCNIRVQSMNFMSMGPNTEQYSEVYCHTHTHKSELDCARLQLSSIERAQVNLRQ